MQLRIASNGRAYVHVHILIAEVWELESLLMVILLVFIGLSACQWCTVYVHRYGFISCDMYVHVHVHIIHVAIVRGLNV